MTFIVLCALYAVDQGNKDNTKTRRNEFSNRKKKCITKEHKSELTELRLYVEKLSKYTYANLFPCLILSYITKKINNESIPFAIIYIYCTYIYIYYMLYILYILSLLHILFFIKMKVKR